MTISSIVALSENDVIGRDGGLPWHLPADLRRFRRITMGHAIVMGRKTYESIGRPLPGRRMVVLTRRRGYEAPGAEVVHSLDEAIELLEGEDEVFFIGGEEVFRLALPVSRRLYITRVHARVEGDVVFPEDGLRGFRLVMEETHGADEKHAHRFTFQVWERE